MKTTNDRARYRANLQAEREGAELYRQLAAIEQDPHLAELYRRMAEMEQRHATLWGEHLQRLGEPIPPYTPGWRTQSLVWLARRFGISAVLPLISAQERGDSAMYERQPEARAAGLPADERSHARLFHTLQASGNSGVAGSILAQFEGRHRATGGNALRAA